KLLDMHLDELIAEETYKKKKSKLEREKRILEEKLSDTSHSLDTLRTKIEDAIDFAANAQYKFLHGSRADKHQVLIGLGSNVYLENKKVKISLYKHYEELSEFKKWPEKYKDWIEPQKYTDIYEKRPL